MQSNIFIMFYILLILLLVVCIIVVISVCSIRLIRLIRRIRLVRLIRLFLLGWLLFLVAFLCKMVFGIERFCVICACVEKKGTDHKIFVFAVIKDNSKIAYSLSPLHAKVIFGGHDFTISGAYLGSNLKFA